MDSSLILNTSATMGAGALRLEGANNWTSWKFQVKVILKALNVFGVVDGSDAYPEGDDNKIKEWTQRDAKAQGVIVTRLSNNIMLQVSTCESAKEMWDKLMTVFEQKSEVSLHILQQKFFEMKFDQDDMAMFLARVEEIVAQIKQAKGDIPENMVITKIITSLPQKYGHFVSAWDSVPTDKRTKSELTARLLIEEQRSKVHEANESKAFTAKEGRKCFKCGKIGHLKKDCRSKKVVNNGSDKYCKNCKKQGHTDQQCWHKKSESKINKQNAFIVSAVDALICNIEPDCRWYLDSGASEHMCKSESSFSNYQTLSMSKEVMIGDGSTIKAIGTGDIQLEAYDGEAWVPTILQKALHVPELKVNLFSVSAALDKNYEMLSTSNECKFIREKAVHAIAKREHKMYVMMFKPKEEAAMVGQTRLGIEKWHTKMAHQNSAQVKEILNRSNIQFTEASKETCIPCLQGKQHRLPFESSETRGQQPGEILHMDVCGPMETTSLGGAKYFLLIKDDYTKFIKVYFLKSKSETVHHVEEFLNETKTRYDHKIKIVRTDNGTEFINYAMKTLLSQHGIQHQKSVVYTPEQNGAAEREMRTVVEAARTMLAESCLQKEFWAEAVNTAVYVLNRTGKSRTKHKTPFELWSKKQLFDINNLQIFGSRVSVHIPGQHRSKWDNKSQLGIFVGYGENVKGYRIYFPEKREVEVKRDVVFIKEANHIKQNYESTTSCDISNNYTLEEQETFEEGSEVDNSNRIEIIEEFESEDDQEPKQQQTMKVTKSDKETESNRMEECESSSTEQSIEERERSGKRLRKKPTWMEEYETSFLSYNSNDPLSYEEAMNRGDKHKWEEAIQKELKTLAYNNTWEEVTKVPQGAEIVNSKWIFKTKNMEGELIYKTRLVAKGFEQTNCDNLTYTPVAKITSFRIFMAMARQMDLPVFQMDVVGAFLYGNIKECVFMRLPDGKLCKLNKSIYGLKKSPRYWNQRFSDFMQNENFIKSTVDPCLYIKKCDRDTLYALLYVDDLLFFGSNEDDNKNFKIKLCTNFQMKDLGLASNYLGISIKQDMNSSITVLNQKAYLEKILSDYQMTDCKSVSTPIEQNYNFNLLARDNSENQEIESKCRMLIGSLLYACCTRPDLCVAISFLSRYQHCASNDLFKSLKRILRYIKGTINLSLIYRKNKNFELKGYCDADWAGDKIDRKSTTGYIFSIFGNPVSWCSKKQPNVSLSSTEAEYNALGLAITEGCWLKNLIKEFGYDSKIYILEDNQSVIRIAENNESNKRLKHMDVKYCFINEKVSSGLVKITYINTDCNTADMFTKPLGKQLFERFRGKVLFQFQP